MSSFISRDFWNINSNRWATVRLPRKLTASNSSQDPPTPETAGVRSCPLPAMIATSPGQAPEEERLGLAVRLVRAVVAELLVGDVLGEGVPDE